MTHLHSWLQRVQALCDAATKGPWYGQRGLIFSTNHDRISERFNLPDEMFVTTARTDLPTALKLIAYLQTRVTREHSEECRMEYVKSINARSVPICICEAEDFNHETDAEMRRIVEGGTHQAAQGEGNG